jgi:hypothetical protein
MKMVVEERTVLRVKCLSSWLIFNWLRLTQLRRSDWRHLNVYALIVFQSILNFVFLGLVRAKLRVHLILIMNTLSWRLSSLGWWMIRASLSMS